MEGGEAGEGSITLTGGGRILGPRQRKENAAGRHALQSPPRGGREMRAMTPTGTLPGRVGERGARKAEALVYVLFYNLLGNKKP